MVFPEVPSTRMLRTCGGRKMVHCVGDRCCYDRDLSESELLGESATEHDERVHPVGFAVQRALMSYLGSDDTPDPGRLRERVNERREGQRISADLSLLVADRGVLGAEVTDDPVRMAAAKWNLGHILLARGLSRRLGWTSRRGRTASGPAPDGSAPGSASVSRPRLGMSPLGPWPTWVAAPGSIHQARRSSWCAGCWCGRA
jgi:hypothetical protein